jgi:uncharacterized protein
MVIEELALEECHRLLERTHLGRLACVADQRPYIVPTYFTWDQGYLYAFATLGQKIQWMRANPLVCVEVDEIQTQFEWTSVVALGRYEELPDVPEWEFERSVAHAHLQTWAMWWDPASAAVGPPSSAQSRPPIYYRISVESMTGRRAVSDEPRGDDPAPPPRPHRKPGLFARIFAAFRQ